MANTFHQVFVQIVFFVKHREYLIPQNKKEELHKYITGIVENKNCKMIAVNSMPDHLHFLVGLIPSLSISDLVKDIKIATNRLINNNKWVKGKFQRQDGFGAFSYSKSQIDLVASYILNQEKHHKKKTFKEEYLEMLDKFGVEYNSDYVFDIK